MPEYSETTLAVPPKRFSWLAGIFHFPWVNVALAALLMVATLPGRTQGLGLITEPLLADLRLDRVVYANINLWATLLGAAFCFPAGYLIDRFGLRLTSTAFVLALGLTVCAMSRFGGGVPGLFLLIFLTRGFGQSALSVASITAVGKTTGKKVGLSMGIFSFLLTIFFMIAFVLVGRTVTDFGWRKAWQQIGIALLMVVAPLALILLSSKRSIISAEIPESIPAATGDAARRSYSLAQALRTRAFWIFGLATALFNLVASGLGLFNEAVLAEHGFDQNTFHTFLAVTTFATLIGQIICGGLAQRQPPTQLMGAGLLLYAVALVMLPFVNSFPRLWFFAGLIGIAAGFIIVIFFAIWSEVFGRVHLGRIQGAAQALTVLSSAIGPVLFAKCALLTGSYTPLIALLSALVLLLAIASWNVKLPQSRRENF